VSGGQVNGVVEAERRAVGVGSLEPFLAEMGAHLDEAVLAVARFELLPRLSGWVDASAVAAVSSERCRTA
jgi:hypothetical protein